MIISGLLIALFLSFALHIYSLFTFIKKKSNVGFKIFVSTTMSNVMIAGTSIVVMISNPEILTEVDVIKVTWVLSGIIMLIALIIQIIIFVRIYKRSKDPANYHTNYFGRKVLHSSVVSRLDLLVFFGTMPFLIMGGAYFIAKLINYLR